MSTQLILVCVGASPSYLIGKFGDVKRFGSKTPVRCLDDVDDEVRDRATLYLKTFEEKPLADVYVKEGL